MNYSGCPLNPAGLESQLAGIDHDTATWSSRKPWLNETLINDFFFYLRPHTYVRTLNFDLLSARRQTFSSKTSTWNSTRAKNIHTSICNSNCKIGRCLKRASFNIFKFVLRNGKPCRIGSHLNSSQVQVMRPRASVTSMSFKFKPSLSVEINAYSNGNGVSYKSRHTKRLNAVFFRDFFSHRLRYLHAISQFTRKVAKSARRADESQPIHTFMH